MAMRLVSKTTVYDKYAISRKFSAQDTSIKAIQGNISLLVSESEIEELKNGNKTMYSKLSTVQMDVDSINLSVSSSEYKDIDGVLTAISQARSDITLNKESIELKVSKDSVISSINQTAEAIKIDANKISLTGNGLIEILNTGTTSIVADRIKLEGLVTANGNFKILEDGSIQAENGKFTGSANITGGSIRLTSDATQDYSQFSISNSKYKSFLSPSRYSAMDSRGLDYGAVSLDVIGGLSIYDSNGNFVYLNTGALSLRSGSIDCGSYMSVGGFLTCNGRASFKQAVSIEGYTTVNDTVSSTGIYCKGNLVVQSGFTKAKAADTINYGTRLLSAYETPEPMFGDLGHNTIGVDGTVIIQIEPIFQETISTEYGYYIFLQSYSNTPVWVSSKELTFFVVAGTPGTEFDWEITAHQKGFENTRLECIDMELLEAEANAANYI